MKKFLFLVLFLPIFIFAQNSEEVSLGKLKGTLLSPKNAEKCVLIIAGSGPTDRNGNNPQMMNNSLKMIAEALNQKGIASLRYDKRGIAASKDSTLKESNLRFDHFIEDAVNWADWLKNEKKIQKNYHFGA